MLKRIIRFKLVIGVILIIGLVLAHLITAYVFGKQAQNVLNLQFKTLTDSPYIVVNHYMYKRGFFSSEISADLSLNSQGISNILKVFPNINESEINGRNYYIHYTTHITHGIFAGILNGEFSPTIAVANSTIKYPASLTVLLGKFFGTKYPLYVKNTIYINKSGKFVISSPSFDYEEALSGVKIVWKGMNLVTKYNREFTKFDNQLSVPNFQLHAPTKGDIFIDNLRYSSNSEYSKNKIKVGDTNLRLNQITVRVSNNTNSSLGIGDLLNTLTGLSVADFLNELDAINPMDFTLTKISYNAKSSDNGEFFNAKALVNFESLVTESKIYGPLKVDIEINHLLSNAFSHMIDQLGALSVESSVSSEEGKNKLITTLKKYFAPILVNSPILKINHFTLMVPSGEIKLDGAFTTVGFELNDMNNEQKFLKTIQAKFNFSLPKDVVSYLLMLQMKYFLNAGNAEMDKQSAEALNKVVNILLNNQLTTWKKKGYIKEKNGILTSNLIYKDGKLTLIGD